MTIREHSLATFGAFSFRGHGKTQSRFESEHGRRKQLRTYSTQENTRFAPLMQQHVKTQVTSLPKAETPSSQAFQRGRRSRTSSARRFSSAARCSARCSSARQRTSASFSSCFSSRFVCASSCRACTPRRGQHGWIASGSAKTNAVSHFKVHSGHLLTIVGAAFRTARPQ